MKVHLSGGVFLPVDGGGGSGLLDDVGLPDDDGNGHQHKHHGDDAVENAAAPLLPALLRLAGGFGVGPAGAVQLLTEFLFSRCAHLLFQSSQVLVVPAASAARILRTCLLYWIPAHCASGNSEPLSGFMDFWRKSASGPPKSAGSPSPPPPDRCRTGRAESPPEPPAPYPTSAAPAKARSALSQTAF